MARPRKTAEFTYRIPRFSKSSNRWRLTIEHGHGSKDFWWPDAHPNVPCPPQVVAAAVAVQDQWRQTQANWSALRFFFEQAAPEKDWSKPVWVTPDQIAHAEAFVEKVRSENRRNHEVQTAYSLAALGLDRIADVLVRLTPNSPENPGGPWEGDRLSLLRDLRPAIERHRVREICVEQAIDEFLAAVRCRTALKIDGIVDDTYRSVRKGLLSAFGLSLGTPRVRKRQTPIDPAQPLTKINEEQVLSFANYWKGLPEGVRSSSTVRNFFGATRKFLKWCATRKDYGFVLPDNLSELRAAGVKTRPVDFDAAVIAKVLAAAKTRGGERLRMYTIFGLVLGYYPSDIADIRNDEFHESNGEYFIHRFRSKERRPKRGSRPIRVKHWVPPELVNLIAKYRVKLAQVLVVLGPDLQHRGFAMYSNIPLPLYRGVISVP